MGKNNLQPHQRSLLNFDPSRYTSYNSWRSNFTHLFLCPGKQCNIFHLKNQCNKRKPSDRFTQCMVYLYDLYYHLPNYGLGKVLNSHDVHKVTFQNFTKFQFPPPLHSNLKITSRISPLTQGWTVRKLMGGGGGGQVQTKYSGKGKSN